MTEPMLFYPAHQLDKNLMSPSALIILNTPFQCDENFAQIWKKSKVKLCADGGANRLMDAVKQRGDPTRFIPTAIVGDCDSLKPGTESFYTRNGCSVIRSSDLYSTDFEKTLNVARDYLRPLDPHNRINIIVYASLAGRVDHGLAILSSLLHDHLTPPSTTNLWLISESSLSWLLHPGTNIIHGLKSGAKFTPNVGIIPVYGPSIISTKGLEWDVTDWRTEMGWNVSSSNHVMQDEVTIITKTWMLFTVKMVDVAR